VCRLLAAASLPSLRRARPAKYRVECVLVGSILLSGCSKLPTRADPVVFEVSRYWYGMSQPGGRFITASGKVYEYYHRSRPSEDYMLHKAGLSADQVRARYGPPAYIVGSVPEGELRAQIALLENLKRDVLLTHSTECPGVTNMQAWLPDSRPGTYQSVIVSAGNIYRNAAPETSALMGWLQGFALPEYSRPCIEKPCDPAACSPGNPWCSLGPYRDVTQCSEVPSCAACGATVCVIDRRGGRHCVLGRCASACDCTLDVCAGGRDWCRTGSDGGLTCLPP
jgi:hypothetical protein